MPNCDALNPAWQETLRRRRIALLVLLFVLFVAVLAAVYLWLRLNVHVTIDYRGDREHSNYGSVGPEEGRVCSVENLTRSVRAAHAAQRSKRPSPAYSAALRARLGMHPRCARRFSTEQVTSLTLSEHEEGRADDD
jgi:hypothetical protein